MVCPFCKAENDSGADMCFTCGRGLTGLTQGSVIADRYEILKPLGRGGMGVVYKANDRVLDEPVAIKVLRAGFADQPELQQRFLQEIKLARRVSHKNVCRIHEYGEDGSLRYISMAFVDGEDLKRILKDKGPLPPEEAYDAMIQVAEGLQAIHDEGIVHRDLKTPNIMRDAKGVVRLMDFGIAKDYAAAATQGLTTTGMIIGTPEYISPEQAQGRKIDARSDLYALGIVTFEVFTGDVPFRADSAFNTIRKHIQQAPPLDGPEAARIPRALVPVLRKALAKDPGLRHPSAREMADALRQAQAATVSRLDSTAGRGLPATLSEAATGPTAVPAPTRILDRPASRPRVAETVEPESSSPSRKIWVAAAMVLLALLLAARHRRPLAAPAAMPAATPGANAAPATVALQPTPPPATQPAPQSAPVTDPAPQPDAEGAPAAPLPGPADDGRLPLRPLAEGMQRACEGGTPKACFGLAEMYRTGRGVPQDFARAAPLYERACDRGLSQACTHLGFLYKMGRGVPEDAERAVVLLRRGCDGHDGWACKALREMNR